MTTSTRDMSTEGLELDPPQSDLGPSNLRIFNHQQTRDSGTCPKFHIPNKRPDLLGWDHPRSVGFSPTTHRLEKKPPDLSSKVFPSVVLGHDTFSTTKSARGASSRKDVVKSSTAAAPRMVGSWVLAMFTPTGRP